MNKEEAKKTLTKMLNYGEYIHYCGHSTVTFDGYFSLDELKAITWWMENKDIKLSKENVGDL